eukprot:TRINITY_DN4626_c0_g1_i1.p1 TRINITY_DN4626_c0_g1~~TRINITY_DN4626_c0_g1_i1.p1  ORF type:complete len:853 (-),score=217.84 TRINITY_DN4626_c0_g1_i1:25-2583(-)
MIYKIDISSGKGRIWNSTPQIQEDTGLFSTVSNQLSPIFEKKNPHLARSSHLIQTTFNSHGDILAVLDQVGKIYLLFVTQNRFSQLKESGYRQGVVRAVGIWFHTHKRSELFVSLSDGVILVYDIITSTLLETLHGHHKPVDSLTTNHDATLLLTSSNDVIILWKCHSNSTRQYTRSRVLDTLSQPNHPVMVKPAFLGAENTTYLKTQIAVGFADGSVNVWNCESFTLQYRLAPPKPQLPYALFSFSKYGEYLALTPQPNNLSSVSTDCITVYLWQLSLSSPTTPPTPCFDLPPSVRKIVQMEWVPLNSHPNYKNKTSKEYILAVLGSDGVLYFIDVTMIEGGIIHTLQHKETIQGVSFSAHGRYLACSTNDGNVQLHDLYVLLRDFLEIFGENNNTTKYQSHDSTRNEFLTTSHPKQETEDDWHRDYTTETDVEENLSKKLDDSSEAENGEKNEENSDNTELGESNNSDELLSEKNDNEKNGSETDNFVENKGIEFDHKSTFNRESNGKEESNHNGQDDGSNGDFNQESGLSIQKIKKLLKMHGEYPPKYRLLIWKTLLSLPSNNEAFKNLLKLGTHPSFINLHKTLPIQNRRLFKKMERNLSALAHWAPVFSEVPWLSSLIFPIVKIFSNDDLGCFETLVTFLTNWCSDWFDYTPHPPLQVLKEIETLLSIHDAPLLHHFTQLGVTSLTYCFPLLSTLFSEVFQLGEWCIMFDHLVSNPPPFLLYFVVAYLRYFRGTLLSTNNIKDFEFFFHHVTPVDILHLIQSSYRLIEKTPASYEPTQVTLTREDPNTPLFTALPQGTYPIFNRQPKRVWDYGSTLYHKIKKHEDDYLRHRRALFSSHPLPFEESEQ